MSYPVPRQTVVVPLSAPVEWFDKVIKEVAIEEPTAAQFFEIGPPQILVGNGAGGGSIVDVPAALNAYAVKCVKVEQADTLLRLLPLSDGRAIKRALLGFFQDAPEETSE